MHFQLIVPNVKIKVMETLRECLAWAEEKQVAIGHFNISDSEGFKAVTEEAKRLGLPVIIGISEGESDFLGLQEAISLVQTARKSGFPIFINADHVYSLDRAEAVIDAGIDSVIIDAADKTFEENIKLTKDVVNYAKAKNSEILVEGELGFIGKSSKLLEQLPEGVSDKTQTRPEEAAEFVKATKVDLLAPSVGNIHGMVKTGNPELNIDRIKTIASVTKIPLVLHGGSGIKDEDFIEAINAGVRIIHINTELRMAYRGGVEAGLKTGELAPYKFLAEGVEEMRQVVSRRLKLFNKL